MPKSDKSRIELERMAPAFLEAERGHRQAQETDLEASWFVGTHG